MVSLWMTFTLVCAVIEYNTSYYPHCDSSSCPSKDLLTSCRLQQHGSPWQTHAAGVAMRTRTGWTGKRGREGGGGREGWRKGVGEGRRKEGRGKNTPLFDLNRHRTFTYFGEAMDEEHERFGGITSSDVMEPDPIGCYILVGTKTGVQETRRGDWGWRKWNGRGVKSQEQGQQSRARGRNRFTCRQECCIYRT